MIIIDDQKQKKNQMPFCLIPTQLGGPTSSQWDGYNRRTCAHEFDGVFPVNGIDRYMVSDDRFRHNISLVSSKHVGKKSYVNVELRADHTNMYRSTSTLNLSITPWTKMQRNEYLMRIPYVNDAIPVHILLRALGWKDDLEHEITVEDKISAAIYRKARLFFAAQEARNARNTTNNGTLNVSVQETEQETEQDSSTVPTAKRAKHNDGSHHTGTTNSGVLDAYNKMEDHQKLNLRELMLLFRASMPSTPTVLQQLRERAELEHDQEQQRLANPADGACGLLKCECAAARAASSAPTEGGSSMRFYGFSGGVFSRLRRKKRRRAGQAQVCLTQEDALLFISLSADDPSRIRRQMFPTSSTTVGQTTDSRHSNRYQATAAAATAAAVKALEASTASAATALAEREQAQLERDEQQQAASDSASATGNVKKSSRKHKTVGFADTPRTQPQPVEEENEMDEENEEDEEEEDEEEEEDLDVKMDHEESDDEHKVVDTNSVDTNSDVPSTSATTTPAVDLEEEEEEEQVFGMHLTPEQKAKYCPTFMAKHKLISNARKTILKEGKKQQAYNTCCAASLHVLHP